MLSQVPAKKKKAKKEESDEEPEAVSSEEEVSQSFPPRERSTPPLTLCHFFPCQRNPRRRRLPLGRRKLLKRRNLRMKNKSIFASFLLLLPLEHQSHKLPSLLFTSIPLSNMIPCLSSLSRCSQFKIVDFVSNLESAESVYNHSSTTTLLNSSRPFVQCSSPAMKSPLTIFNLRQICVKFCRLRSF